MYCIPSDQRRIPSGGKWIPEQEESSPVRTPPKQIKSKHRNPIKDKNKVPNPAATSLQFFVEEPIIGEESIKMMI